MNDKQLCEYVLNAIDCPEVYVNRDALISEIVSKGLIHIENMKITRLETHTIIEDKLEIMGLESKDYHTRSTVIDDLIDADFIKISI